MTKKTHLDTFEILRYIQKRMKACGCPRNAISCDVPERVINMARRVLEFDRAFHTEQTEELFFYEAGNRWVSGVERKKWKEIKPSRCTQLI